MNEQAAVYRLEPESLTIYDVARLEAEFRSLGEGQSCQLDLANVSEADTAGLQWLLSVRQRSLTAGRNCEIPVTPAAVSTALQTLGLEHLMGEHHD